MFVTAAAFASDAITLAEALTVNVGLRFDHSRTLSHDLPMLDSHGNETDVVARGLGTTCESLTLTLAIGRQGPAPDGSWPRRSEPLSTRFSITPTSP